MRYEIKLTLLWDKALVQTQLPHDTTMYLQVCNNSLVTAESKRTQCTTYLIIPLCTLEALWHQHKKMKIPLPQFNILAVCCIGKDHLPNYINVMQLWQNNVSTIKSSCVKSSLQNPQSATMATMATKRKVATNSGAPAD